jgi:hypothetical protein
MGCRAGQAAGDEIAPCAAPVTVTLIRPNARSVPEETTVMTAIPLVIVVASRSLKMMA